MQQPGFLAAIVVAGLSSVAAMLIALWAAAKALKIASRLAASLKRFETALIRVSELDDLCASLLESHAKLRSRVGMRELRARAETPDISTLTGPAWKQAMRQKIGLVPKLKE